MERTVLGILALCASEAESLVIVKDRLTDEVGHVMLNQTHVIEHMPLLMQEKMTHRAASMAAPLLERNLLVDVLVFVQEHSRFGKEGRCRYSDCCLALARIGG